MLVETQFDRVGSHPNLVTRKIKVQDAKIINDICFILEPGSYSSDTVIAFLMAQFESSIVQRQPRSTTLM